MNEEIPIEEKVEGRGDEEEKPPLGGSEGRTMIDRRRISECKEETCHAEPSTRWRRKEKRNRGGGYWDECQKDVPSLVVQTVHEGRAQKEEKELPTRTDDQLNLDSYREARSGIIDKSASNGRRKKTDRSQQNKRKIRREEGDVSNFHTP